MPEYLAPGVYVEETSYRTKSIEGQSTSTAGFVGPTRFGPMRGVPEVLTSVADFERIYGGLEQLAYDKQMHNYMAHAIRAFFGEGGGRVYLSRTFLPKDPDKDTGVAYLDLGPLQQTEAEKTAATTAATKAVTDATKADTDAKANVGKGTTDEQDAATKKAAAAAAVLKVATARAADKPKTAVDTAKAELATAQAELDKAPDDTVKAAAVVTAKANLAKALGPVLFKLQARYPGAMGNMRVTITLRCGLNVLAAEGSGTTAQKILRGVSNYDMVWLTKKGTTPATAPEVATQIYWLDRQMDGQRVTYQLRQGVADTDSIKQLSALDPATEEVHVITMNVAVAFDRGGGKFGPDQLYAGLSLHPNHPAALSTVFAAEPGSRATELYVPLVVAAPTDPYQVFTQTFLTQKDATGTTLGDTLREKGAAIGDVGVSFQMQLAKGNDGLRPTGTEYEGDEGNKYHGLKSGLFTFQDVEDISIVAAPGSTFDNDEQGAEVTRLLLGHCAKMRYRAAVLDAPNGKLVSEIRAYRAQFDSTYGALYYPWIRILDPLTQTQISLPPSGFVAGIWARTDGQTGVHKAPANQEVRLAAGLEIMLNKGQQDVLNPEGINCFRFFEGRGFRLWGARTISSDSEWKYVNLRRYFAYLEHSIDKATQWVVFESNGPTLWDKVKTSVEDFLFNEWKNDRLLGAAAAEAYFVRCDKSTMTQNDLDNGRLIVQVGVSPLRPAEFVIFQVGQWTATK